jgi:class 3 adenylate cyclase
MSYRYRISITVITVFATSALLALSVGLVLYLGLNQAAETTRLLWADQSRTLIDTLQNSLGERLEPVRDQALWVAEDVTDLSDPAALDAYFFGVLAATPQVTGIAIITLEGISRRWERQRRIAITEDWSQKPWMKDYLKQSQAASGPAWRAPIFEESTDSTTLLHDIPLRDTAGRFIGVFAQIVSVRDLSSYLSSAHSNTGVTPFVLYNRDFVLAHPSIGIGNSDQPLQTINEFDDLVLQRIWTPDEDAAFISAALDDTQASGVFWGDRYYLFLYRDIEGFGPLPWTIGVYLNTTLIENDQTDNLTRALLAGIAVLVLAIIATLIIGRRISVPIRRIAPAANAVNAGDLDNITPLGASHVRELDEAGNAFNNMIGGLRERALIRETLGRFVPEKVASSLLSGGGDIPVLQTQASILFCDIEGFTRLTETHGPVKIVTVLNAYFSAMVDILERRGGVVTQFQGDAILATFNVPITDPEHAANALATACEMLDEVALNRYDDVEINIRIGINTGEVVAGAIGAKGRLNYTVHGDAVNLAARLEALNKEHGSRLLVSESTAMQIEASELIQVGETTVRGQTRSIRLFSLQRYYPRTEIRK